MTSMLVTFVVPTLARPSLKVALQSLRDQTDDDWQCIIVKDGAAEGDAWQFLHQELYDDPRFQLIVTPGQGSAGLTRNFGIDAATGRWIAFLDDDDALEPEYVARLRTWDAEGAQLVVFRMEHPTLGILPDLGMPQLQWGGVGISYAVRNDVLGRDRFIKEDLENQGPQGNEDIELLLRLQDRGVDVIIEDYVGYIVRP